MRLQKKILASLLAFISVCLPCHWVQAQGIGVGVAVPGTAVAGSPFTNVVTITNLTGSAITSLVVSNVYTPTTPTFLSGAITTDTGSPLIFSTVSNSANAIIFGLGDTLPGGAVAVITFAISSASGPLTNQIFVVTPFITVTTNAVTQMGTINTDLAVGLVAPASVIVNDPMTISLKVTNLGTASVSGVVVTNTLPASFAFKSATPATGISTNTGRVTWTVGTLAAGASSSVQLSLQPTTNGTFQVSATVGSTTGDTNSANNTVSANVLVQSFIPANLSVANLSQQLNRQTGLLEMRVLVSNNGSNDVPAVRVAVSGITNNVSTTNVVYLYNASGTNAGVPYALYNAALLSGASVNMVLEFYTLKRVPLENVTLQALAVPAINLSVTPTNTPIGVTNFTLSEGGFLIEFPATIGKTYTIFYSDTTNFTTALMAQPSIVAPATRVQWIDNGPPKTISHPTNTPSRFYRVQQAP